MNLNVVIVINRVIKKCFRFKLKIFLYKLSINEF